MKRLSVFLLFISLFIGMMMPVRAQAPYRHGIGATIGTTQAFSYKVFPCNHFAIQLDLGTKYCYVYGSHLWSLELAPNFMYEGHFTAGLYGFAGLGGSIGYNWQPFSYIHYGDHVSRHNAKGGLNGIFGLEYKFEIPLALQFDFRPGYRCVFNRYFDDHKFDWGLNFGVRYTF
jgi:hypothetical protein